jgi:general secretion pathway protein M
MNGVMTMLRGAWAGRSAREQALLGVAGGLVVVLLLSLLVVQPLIGFNDRARDDYAAAMRLYRSVQADAAAYRRLASEARSETDTGGSLRSVAGATALRHDIALARMVPSEDGSLTVNIDRADSRAVMGWLVELENRFGIRVVSGTMDRAGEGVVEASFVLRRQGGR